MEDSTRLRSNVAGECGRLGVRDAAGTLKLDCRAEAIRATLYCGRMELEGRTWSKLLGEHLSSRNSKSISINAIPWI
ncbi:hypothetical protein L3X38_041830 [Prunus dulcis]|uniref:Uncharacterized protein n=1 Tax=Prunus dulcis TaxID=3755 RepID=A0AAD4UVE4_PRUDU|nr:hypothetical protein L3X38_041830 [Prunus dulcis]